jgi:Cu-processing system ATP-binding protein
MISIQGLTKHYGKTRVVENLDFEIGTGRVISMLGPNGSGKSTIIKCILNLVRPNAGTIEVDGISSKELESRRKIAYMPQVAHFAENISARRLIELISKLRNEYPDPRDLVEYFELSEHMTKPLSDLSGGSRQKVSAILAFLFDTPIIILDEPTVGLDPVARVNFKKLVLQEKVRGKTIFFTSHITSDVEEVADEIAFLLDGGIVFRGTTQELVSSTGERNLEHAIAKFIKNKHEV